MNQNQTPEIIPIERDRIGRPYLCLQGDWLAEWGFPARTKVTVIKEIDDPAFWMVADLNYRPVFALSECHVKERGPRRTPKLLLEGYAAVHCGFCCLDAPTHVRLVPWATGILRLEPVYVRTQVLPWLGNRKEVA